MNFYRFEAEFYSIFDDKNIKEKGVLKATNYSTAAQQIEDYFGNDLVAITFLSALEATNILLDDIIVDELKKER